MSDFVGSPEDMFSRNAAHTIYIRIKVGSRADIGLRLKVGLVCLASPNSK